MSFKLHSVKGRFAKMVFWCTVMLWSKTPAQVFHSLGYHMASEKIILECAGKRAGEVQPLSAAHFHS
eukprot:788484-Amphidinium_carterae.1